MFQGIIRKFQSKDAEQIEKIFDQYWSDAFREHLSRRLSSPGMDWYVAEDRGEIVGVAASRQAPERMRTYAKTDRVIELYVSAAKYKREGIGTALRNTRIDQARKEGFKEAVFFSGETHRDSWAFHDDSDFKRVGDAIAPDGEHGMIWLMNL